MQGDGGDALQRHPDGTIIPKRGRGKPPGSTKAKGTTVKKPRAKRVKTNEDGTIDENASGDEGDHHEGESGSDSDFGEDGSTEKRKSKKMTKTPFGVPAPTSSAPAKPTFTFPYDVC